MTETFVPTHAVALVKPFQPPTAKFKTTVLAKVMAQAYHADMRPVEVWASIKTRDLVKDPWVLEMGDFASCTDIVTRLRSVLGDDAIAVVPLL